MKEDKKNKRVVVAMSGGIDSSVAAALLKNQGYEVIGVFMQFWFPKGEKYGENRCCSLEAFNEAKDVADKLDIRLHKLNFGREFKKYIVDEFLNEYKKGLTPNPCVACNKFIKFDLLLKHARTVFKAEYLATGHYVKIKGDRLYKGKDDNKDQSYFLYNIKPASLGHLLFPLGDLKKPKVREMAKKFGLKVHDKSESQEICFVGDSHYDFLNKFLKLKQGEIVEEKILPLSKGRWSKTGGVLGKHNGLPLYTIGQRSGIGLAGGPWYVSGFDHKKNILYVTRDQKKSNIFQRELVAKKLNWISGIPKFPIKCQAKVRYRSKVYNCLVEKVSGGVKVTFKSKQRAVMPGQSVVFYKGREVLGGGVIV